ncbi:MAG: 6-phosphofructokinase [Bacillota bacterium]
MNTIKTIGVLTSGGDAPGMNAAIRAVVRAGIYHGLKVMGIKRGYNGLINGEIFEMDLRSVSDIIKSGGTILQTARCEEFRHEEGILKGIKMAKVFDIDAIVVIGGDGSYRGAKDMSRLGMNVIGLPGTIDNDIACSEYTIGYDTAMNTALEALDKIKDTASSHERCSVFEVMGRHAGYIALNVAIAGGAEVSLIPEKTFDMNKDVIMPIMAAKNRGKTHFVVIVAEGVGKAMEIAEKIEEKTGIEARATILGHVQRGGNPSVVDRVVASKMGAYAVELLKAGKCNKIVGMKDSKVVDYDIVEALDMKKSIDEYEYDLVRVLSM